MFAEFLNNESWLSPMPGISVCSFTGGDQPREIPVYLEQAHAEVLFCISGSLNLQSTNGSQISLEPREILLLSDCSQIHSCRETEPVTGIVIAVHQSAAMESLRELSARLGNLPLSMRRVGEMMSAAGGFRVVPASPWSRAAFYALRRIPREEQGSYCIMKVFELLYLMCSQSQETMAAQQDPGGSLNGVAAGMKKYMEEHMDEKLTITELSHRFHLSRTACKSCFRSCYGQPIHSWLLDRRMERAAELLEHTKMPILQVAQSVGYTGVSQFNVAFRQRYGKSPREYRKMSVSVVF